MFKKSVPSLSISFQYQTKITDALNEDVRNIYETGRLIGSVHCEVQIRPTKQVTSKNLAIYGSSLKKKDNSPFKRNVQRYDSLTFMT